MSRRVVTTEESRTLYPSPRWPTHLIVRELADILPRGTWWEPCVGDASIVCAVDEVRPPDAWVCCEIVPEHAEVARRHAPRATVHVGDFRQAAAAMGRADVVISNFPFPDATELARVALAHADWVLLLQRLDWMEGEGRRVFFQEFGVEPCVLPNRPRFLAHQDSGGYAWYLFHPDRRARPVRWLPVVPLAQRQEHRHQLRLGVQAEQATAVVAPVVVQPDLFGAAGGAR